MVIEVVVCQIGKEGTSEVYSVDASLNNRVRRTLHKAVLATTLDHCRKHSVEADSVGGGVGRLNILIINLIDYG